MSSPAAAMLICPSEVANTPVGMLVGWLLPACPGTSCADRPARRLEVQHGDLRAEQGTGHPLALAGLLAFQQRDQDAHGGEDAGGQVGDRNADAHRSLPRQAGDRHQPAHALGDLIEAGTIAIRPVLAEPGNRGIDQPLVDLAQRFVIDAEAELHVGPIVLHHHVGAFRPGGAGSPAPRAPSGSASGCACCDAGSGSPGRAVRRRARHRPPAPRS